MGVWILLILFIVFLAGSGIVLYWHAESLERMERALEDKLWDRSNRIPLLAEFLRLDGSTFPLNELLDLRAKANTSIDIGERIGFEKQLSHDLAMILQMAEKSQGLQTNTEYLSLKDDFKRVTEEINIAVNDFNWKLQEWNKYRFIPWHKILEKLFAVRQKTPLQTV